MLTGRKLVDRTVASALETLIRKMRAGALPPLPETDEMVYQADREEHFIIENIRRHWAKPFATAWRPSPDDRIGILRTILGSLEAMKSPGRDSQSYLQHIARFLTDKLGVTAKVISADDQPLPEPEAKPSH